MKKQLRVGNISYHVGEPYHLLDGLDFVDYEENLATENARKLQEGELDVALIPVAAFAQNGSFVGLDFGLGEDGGSRLVRLVSHTPASELETVYVYDDSNASTLLLQLLLHNHWKISPRIIPTTKFLSADRLRPKEGFLIECKEFAEASEQFAVQEDPIGLWHESYGCPWVYLIWATRPGALTHYQDKMMSDTFHRSVAAFRQLDAESLERGEVEPGRLFYYLESQEKKGLELAFQEAYYEQLLPEFEYRSHRFRLLDQTSAELASLPPVESLLYRAGEGKRISLREALSLVESASLADLGLAAESLRDKLFTSNSLSCIQVVSEECFDRTPEGGISIDDNTLESLSVEEASRVLLVPPDELMNDLEGWELFLHDLKVRHDCIIEGFGAPKLSLLSRNLQLPLQDVVGRLVTAGLDEVPSFGGGLLIDKRLQSADISPASWFRTMKWVHRYGAASSCCLRLSHADSWEERLLHLLKLRDLQDVNPGFRYFYCYNGADWSGAGAVEERLRAVLIGRLFLDNVPSVKEIQTATPTFTEALGFSFGVNEARIETSYGNQKVVEDTIDMLQSLFSYGVDFNYRIDTPPRPKNLH